MRKGDGPADQQSGIGEGQPLTVIETLIAAWVSGGDISLQRLHDRMFEQLTDAGGEDDAMCAAFALVEDTIWELEVTPLNLTRLTGWCAVCASPAGLEALLTRFSCLLSTTQMETYRERSVALYGKEIVCTWLGETEATSI